MVLVDTTVWIDLFNNRKSKPVSALKTRIEERSDLCTCGIIYTEVLQGIRNEQEFKKTKSILEQLIYLPIHRHTYEKSIEIYRTLRKKGITIRSTIDCIIAAICLEHDLYLLEKDRDFRQIVKVFPLKLLNYYHGN